MSEDVSIVLPLSLSSCFFWSYFCFPSILSDHVASDGDLGVGGREGAGPPLRVHSSRLFDEGRAYLQGGHPGLPFIFCFIGVFRFSCIWVSAVSFSFEGRLVASSGQLWAHWRFDSWSSQMRQQVPFPMPSQPTRQSSIRFSRGREKDTRHVQELPIVRGESIPARSAGRR